MKDNGKRMRSGEMSDDSGDEIVAGVPEDLLK